VARGTVYSPVISKKNYFSPSEKCFRFIESIEPRRKLSCLQNACRKKGVCAGIPCKWCPFAHRALTNKKALCKTRVFSKFVINSDLQTYRLQDRGRGSRYIIFSSCGNRFYNVQPCSTLNTYPRGLASIALKEKIHKSAELQKFTLRQSIDEKSHGKSTMRISDVKVFWRFLNFAPHLGPL